MPTIIYGDDNPNIIIAPGGDTYQIYAGGANDELYGSSLADLLDGGTGADFMRGFGGNDAYYVDNAGDYVVEDAESGLDAVVSTVSYSMTANVEQLYLSGALAINGLGNDLANYIGGNDADNYINGGLGNDTLVGNGGNDMLVGSLGQDWLDGGSGTDLMVGGADNDTYIVDNSYDQVQENLNEGYDSVIATVNFALGSNVEALILGGTAALVGYGNGLANFMAGNSGANVILSGAGNDTIDGGGGADIMYGEAGDDTYVVDSAFDLVVELANDGYDAVITTASYSLTANVEGLILSGNAGLTGIGNALANSLIGGNGNDTLGGGDGNDFITGGGGANALYGDAGDDTLNGTNGNNSMYGGTGNDAYFVDGGDGASENFNEGIDSVIAAVSFQLNTNFENLYLIGSSALSGYGNSQDNYVGGNDGANYLDAGLGNDTLSGGFGDDTLSGSSGNDWLAGGAGADLLSGGSGVDAFVFFNGDLGTSQFASDRIADFSSGQFDRIDLSGVDANFNTLGDQAFSFIGTSGFRGVAGQLRYEVAAGSTYLSADITGDSFADLWLRVDGTPALASSDFVL